MGRPGERSRRSPLLVALAALLPLACGKGHAVDAGPGQCGSSEATCATTQDCCPGFQCAAGTCLFVGSGNGSSGGSAGQGDGGAGSAGSSSGGGTTVKGSSGGASGSQGSGGASSDGASSSGFSGGGADGGGSEAGDGGEAGPDLCASCDAVACSGAALCACDPDDSHCTDGYCAQSCDRADAGDPALCPPGTTCLPTTDYYSESLPYFVCYPAVSKTCLDAGS
jgi:hypothetical protein